MFSSLIIWFPNLIKNILDAARSRDEYACFLAVLIQSVFNMPGLFDESLELSHIHVEYIIGIVKNSPDISVTTRNEMCSALHVFRYDLKGEVDDLHNALSYSNFTNVSAKFKLGIHYLKQAAFASEMNNLVNNFLLKAESYLKECLKSVFLDSAFLRDTYYILSLIYMLLKNDYESLKCFKQARYAENRIPFH